MTGLDMTSFWCYTPEFHHSNENYRTYLFLAQLYNLGLWFTSQEDKGLVTTILNDNLSQPRIRGESH